MDAINAYLPFHSYICSRSPQCNYTLESCLCFPQLLSQIFVNGSCNEINSPAVAQKHGNVLGASILLSAVPEQTFECEFSLNILNSISCMLWRVIFPADEYQCGGAAVGGDS